ncbi:MAG: dihydroxyacetone kinase family protein [Acetobacteraceae bacterium]
MRKFVNDPRAVMREMLEGFADFAPGQALIADHGVILRADIPADPAQRGVALISGGGSGHEPAHAGYVGAGMLHAAVAGDVFTSPSVDAVLAAIRASAGPAGALLIVKNYTGDRLNFGLAAELARTDGIPCEIVIVADDVALRDTVPPDRRRGIAGTVLVHKVTGAAAADGLPLEAVARDARDAAAALGTMGVALGACTVPAAGTPGFTLADDEMELGLGIHGEPGVSRTALASADAIVTRMLETIRDDLDLRAGEHVALLVNGLGGTPPMELGIIGRHALAVLRAWDIAVARAWCGSFLTALEMPGCSLSVMRVDEARLGRLDAPAGAPAWPGPGHIPAARQVVIQTEPPRAAEPAGTVDPRLRAAAMAVAAALEAGEPELTALDSVAGDGDLGISLARGAAAIRALPDAAWSGPVRALTETAGALRRAIGGSSGPFYATALLRAASVLPRDAAPSATDWTRAFAAGAAAISELGGAKAGDRTMLDALLPAAEAFSAAVGHGEALAMAWSRALAAAEAGVMATEAMHPRLGRASYLGERAIGSRDAGAAGVVVWMRALRSVGLG